MKLAAHLEMNFNSQYRFSERWLAAHRYGFAGCEFVWRNRELSEVVELTANAPLTVGCLGGTTGFQPGGDRPLLTLPEDRDRLANDLEKAIAYAKRISCGTLVFVPGNAIAGWSLERHRQEAVATLKYAAPLLEQAGITAVLEPLNSKIDHKGIYCDNSAEAFRIVEETASPNVKVLYDVYHMQIMEGNLIHTIQSKHSLIGYYHLAKIPGRFEPIGGEVNYGAVLEAIRATGYSGFVGLEYRPSAEPLEVFDRLMTEYRSLADI